MDERIGKSLFGVVVCGTKTVNVVCNLVNQNVVEIEGAKIVDVLLTSVVEQVCAKKDARPPIEAVTIERTRPASLLLPGAREKKDGPKSVDVFGRHSLKAPLDLFARADVDEVRL